MFSGKTTELLLQLRRSAIVNRQVAIIKYQKDTRYSDKEIISHDGIRIPDGVDIFVQLELYPILGELGSGYSVVAIDEGQFFSDLVPVAVQLANNGVSVYVSALNGTFDQKPFPVISELMPYVDDIFLLSAVCMVCYDNAPFTVRTSEETEVEIIGGKERYKPVCRRCLALRK